jgi:hypothetical protein
VSERDAAVVVAAIEAERARAQARFGWTHLELEVEAGAPVVVHGVVAARGSLVRIVRACPFAIDVSAVTVLATGELLALPSTGATLHLRPDRCDASTLTTELDAGDGPVERLQRLAGATLVRTSDGTVGWTEATLGPPARWSEAEAIVDAAGTIGEAWPAWLGAPYKLGGTRLGGVDCSGLVSRLLAKAGLRVPRHSADQVAVAPRDGLPRGAGDLVAVWSHDEAPCHVGLALAEAMVVHASRSRARVVAEPIDVLVARASKVVHVPLAEIVALRERARGVFDLSSILHAV